MSGFDFLIVVLFLLYLTECLVWTPPDAVAFRVRHGAKFLLKIVVKPYHTARRRLALSKPWSFCSAIFICSWPSGFISPDGIVGTQTSFLAFEEVSHVESSGRSLLVNGKRYMLGSSEVQANEWARLLTSLRRQEREERAKQIESHISRSLNTDEAKTKAEVFSTDNSDLAAASRVLFFLAFGLAPLMVWRVGLAGSWRVLLVCVMLNVSLILWIFARAQYELIPTAQNRRWETLITLLVSIPAAMRASRYLARDALALYHPLAIGLMACNDEEFDDLASWTLRHLMFVPSFDRMDDERANTCADWFRGELLKQLSALVYSAGRVPESLIRLASTSRLAGASSYCPRCWCQYGASHGECPDCGGVALKPFEDGC